MSNYEPLVSILMNCFNGEKYLNQAIDSVINQTYTNWELIFWDNQSTDNSRQILQKYKDSRIKYFYSNLHTNLGYARKLAFEKVNGELLAFLDVDDIWFKEKLSLQVKDFEDHLLGISYSNTLWFSKKFKQILYNEKFDRNENTKSLITNYSLSLQTIVLRVKYIKSLSITFNEKYNHICDFDLISRLSTICKIKYYPDILAGWRVHENSESFKTSGLFIIEKLIWINQNFNQKVFKDYKHSIYELENLVLAQQRMNKCLPSPIIIKQLFFSYSSLRNFLYVLFSFLPFIPYITFSLKNYKFNRKWF